MTESENTQEPAHTQNEAIDPESKKELELATGFQLSRVFALLGLVASILALGLVSMVFLNADSRIENLEGSLPVAVNSIEDRVDALNARLKDISSAPAPASDLSEAKNLIFGSELSRTLYLMRYMAGDESLSDDIRQKAARVHAETNALLKKLQAEQ